MVSRFGFGNEFIAPSKIQPWRTIHLGSTNLGEKQAEVEFHLGDNNFPPFPSRAVNICIICVLIVVNDNDGSDVGDDDCNANDVSDDDGNAGYNDDDDVQSDNVDDDYEAGEDEER